MRGDQNDYLISNLTKTVFVFAGECLGSSAIQV